MRFADAFDKAAEQGSSKRKLPAPPTSRQVQAMREYQAKLITEDREKASAIEKAKERARDLPAAREERYLQNWGML